ncbi:uncharacterized protein SCHCODRAFT_02686992 [Schizophyllum commune H4-8]|nr:uncharacterized protein SCHCODRAFT_02686992 [Schizophyllum commune H4-8]KAI5895635.1 hypothetical protein SCHCODRAFT_02686992 [Schizophyllum commune H4-8]
MQHYDSSARLKRARNVPSQIFTISDWILFFYGVSLNHPTNQLYRYILFALTDTERQLQSQLRPLLRQKKIEPRSSPSHRKTFRQANYVVPYCGVTYSPCVNANARQTIPRIGKRAPDDELSPWRLGELALAVDVGTIAHVEAPQLSVNDGNKGADDETLYGSGATGYRPIL